MVHADGFRYMYLIYKDEIQMHNAKVVNKENIVDEISKVLILTAQKLFLVEVEEDGACKNKLGGTKQMTYTHHIASKGG
jgi:hypothetical protein